MKSRKRKE